MPFATAADLKEVRGELFLLANDGTAIRQAGAQIAVLFEQDVSDAIAIANSEFQKTKDAFVSEGSGPSVNALTKAINDLKSEEQSLVRTRDAGKPVDARRIADIIVERTDLERRRDRARYRTSGYVEEQGNLATSK